MLNMSVAAPAALRLGFERGDCPSVSAANRFEPWGVVQMSTCTIASSSSSSKEYMLSRKRLETFVNVRLLNQEAEATSSRNNYLQVSNVIMRRMSASYAQQEASLTCAQFLGRRLRQCTNTPVGLAARDDLAMISEKKRAASITALFTGIVEEMGTVRELRRLDNDADDGWQLTVEASIVLDDVKLGDSIAVNGACLTVTRFDSSSFDVGLAPETLRKTSLGQVVEGSKVNLERSLCPDSRMGGHFVQGHVDGTGEIIAFWPEGDSLWVKVRTSPEILRYVVPKGYIAIDGTSLTVVDVLDEESAFTFMLVAYTQTKIVVPLKNVGQLVNLEVDIVGKYVERLVTGYRSPARALANEPASDLTI